MREMLLKARKRDDIEEEKKRVLVLSLAGMIFLALVALAIGTLGGRPRESISSAPGIRLIPTLPPYILYVSVAAITFLMLGSFVVTFIFIIMRNRERQREDSEMEPYHEPIRPSPIALIATLGPLIFIIGMIVAFFIYARNPPEEEKAPPPVVFAQEEEILSEGTASGSGIEPEAERARRSPILEYILIASAIAFLGAIFAFSIRLLRALPSTSTGEEEDVHEELRRDLVKATEISLEDILREGDYRKAVIACYARMEEVLGKHGFPRAPYQTPMEYMESVLSSYLRSRPSNPRSDASPSAALPSQGLLNLTRLYEIAKFSTHNVGGDDKAEAIRCLVEIKEALSTDERRIR
ncbi:MAG: DUF4129 domain-containing protein [bacterium]